MRHSRKSSGLLLTSLLAFAGLWTGCYTQIHTGGYAERRHSYPPAYQEPDSLESDTTQTSQSETDTLISSRDRETIVIHNYYDPGLYYRGHRYGNWDNSFFYLGFHSSFYRDYYGYYWDSPRHYRRYPRHRLHHGTYHGGGGSYSPSPGEPAPKELFSVPRETPGPAKGKRRLFNIPESSKSGTGSSKPSGKTKSSSESSTAEPKPVQESISSETKPQETYKPLRKGKRR